MKSPVFGQPWRPRYRQDLYTGTRIHIFQPCGWTFRHRSWCKRFIRIQSCSTWRVTGYDSSILSASVDLLKEDWPSFPTFDTSPLRFPKQSQNYPSLGALAYPCEKSDGQGVFFLHFLGSSFWPDQLKRLLWWVQNGNRDDCPLPRRDHEGSILGHLILVRENMWFFTTPTRRSVKRPISISRLIMPFL